ncbi:beta strand repeat-containing protein [Aestuariibacter salexigens]|uniref:beta strand repeat-containing protein n=1 Tax=Aestuariibacter salexigens TaxID=226010 RepID=UPI0003FA32D2|nr:PEP-CTERM sorting domain-containing protein [Aestuariibacter salexigens]
MKQQGTTMSVCHFIPRALRAAPITLFSRYAVIFSLGWSLAFYGQAATISQSVTFETLGQSMWGTGGSTQIQDDLFIGVEWDSGNKKLFEVGDATYGGNGLRVDGRTDGRIGLETGWYIDSGTVNTQLPFQFSLDLPDADELVTNRVVSMGVTDARIQSGAFLETIAPTIQAYANLIVEAEASLKATGCYDVWLDADCGNTGWKKLIDIDADIELLSVNRDPVTGNPDGQIRVLDGFKDLFAVGSTAADVVNVEEVDDPDNPGEKKKKKVSLDLKPKVEIGSTPMVEVDVRIPTIREEETLGSARSVMTNGVENIGSSVLGTSGSDEFLEIGIDMDQMFTTLAGLPPLGVTAGLDFGIGSVSATADLLDVTLSPALELTQEFDLNITDMRVSYAFDRAVEAGLKGQSRSNRNSLNNLALGQQIDLKWTGPDIGITPTYDIDLSLTNKTGITINSSLSIDLLSGSVSGDVAGIDLGTKSFGPLVNLPFNGPSFDLPPLFNDSFALGGLSNETGTKLLLTTAQASWREGRDGNWNTNTNWKNNATPIGNDVVIRGLSSNRSTVTIDSEVSSGNLSLFGNSRLNINSLNGILNVGGSKLHNESNIVLTDGRIVFTKDTTLSGDGKIYLRDYSGRLTSQGSRKTLDVIGQDIIADSGGGRINRINVNLRGDSTLKVTSGTLRLHDTVITGYDSNKRSITGSAGTTIDLMNTDIRNVDFAGNVKISDSFKTRCNSYFAGFCTSETDHNVNYWRTGGDRLARNDGTITLNNTGNMDEKRLYLGGPSGGTLTFENNGTINVVGRSGEEALLGTITGSGANFLLSGTGSLNLAGDDAEFSSYQGRDSLTNGAQHTIRGWGSVEDFTKVTNYGAIVASSTGESLAFFDTDIVNHGVLKADRGILDLDGGFFSTVNVTNKGRVEAVSGGTVRMYKVSNMTSANGTVTLTDGEWVASSGTIAFAQNYQSRFDNRADITLNGSGRITVDGVSLENFGRFTNTGAGTFTLGQGATFHSDDVDNYGLIAMRGGSMEGLYNYAGGLVEGFGTIGGICTNTIIFCTQDKLYNRGTIRASGGELVLKGLTATDSSFINTGRVEVMGGATLRYEELGIGDFFGSGSVFKSNGGTWAAYGETQAANIILDTSSFLSLFGSGGVESLQNVNLVLSGQFANFYTDPLSGGNVNLKTSLTTIGSSASLSLENGQVFVAANNVDNNGLLNLAKGTYQSTNLRNDGTIAGHGTLNVAALDNNGALNVSGGIMTLNSTVANTGGSINVGGQYGDVLRGTYTINNGEVSVGKGGLMDGQGTLNNVKLTNMGTITARIGAYTIDTAAGSTNTGLIQANAGGSLALQNGTINNANGMIKANNASITLTDFTVLNGAVEVIGKNAALRGYGNLENVALKVSEGLISANVNGQKLTIDPSTAAELYRATLQAENGGTLLITNGDFNAAGGTLIRAKNGSIVEMLNIVMVGGQLVTEGSGKIIDLGSSNFTDMTFNANTEVASGGEFNFYGTIVNKQSITVKDGGVLHLHDARVTGLSLTVNPDGTVSETVDEGLLRIEQGAQLILDSGRIDNQRLQNLGQMMVSGANPSRINVVGDTFLNQGGLTISNSSSLFIDNAMMENQGDVDVQAGSEMTVQGVYTQTDGTTHVDGTLSADELVFEEGSLSGNGTIEGDTVIGENATINPGNSPGTLIFTDDLDLFGTFIVEVESTTSFDSLNVFGDVTFDTTTLFDFRFGPDFSPLNLFSLDFLLAANFINANVLSRANFAFSGLSDSFDVDFVFGQGNGLLSLVFFDTQTSNVDVPEPGTVGLMLLMISLLILRQRCARAASR